MLKMFSIICCGILISTTNYVAYAEPYNEANFIITAKDETIVARLKKSETYLANKYVPIWMVRNGKLNRLDSNVVMQEVGPFTTYQDRESSSAAVYFHNRRAFDGTVDVRYIIDNVAIPDISEINNNYEDNEIAAFQTPPGSPAHVLRRAEYGHADKTGPPKTNPPHFEFTAEWIDELRTEEAMEPEQTRNSDDIFYVETLVVFNHKMTNQLFNGEPISVSSITSYILTLFNSVDMLFTKIDSPKIKINIAGIVIEEERDSVPNIATCYKIEQLFGGKIETISAAFADEYVRSYLLDQKQTIPLDSYDIVVYLARYPLHEYVIDKVSRKKRINYLAGGVSVTGRHASYGTRPRNQELIPTPTDISVSIKSFLLST